MKLIFLSDRAWGKSAYSKVVHYLSQGLKSNHHIAQIPMSQALRGGNFNQGDVLIYASGDHPFGEDVAPGYYHDFKADMLIAVKEPWVFSSLYNEAINFVPMAVIDHSPVAAGITSKLHTAFKVIAISRFGQRELKQKGIESTYIPHGVDTNIYKVPTPEEKVEYKKRWYFNEDDFVIGMVTLNRSRKMIPHQLRGIKIFKENNPDIKNFYLFIWTNVRAGRRPFDAQAGMGVADVGVDLLPEMVSLGLLDPIRWPSMDDMGAGIPEVTTGHAWDMVSLYGCMDGYLLASGGEGAGLTYLEALASGLIPICTDYAAGPEYVGPGITVPMKDYIILNTPGTRYAIPDEHKIADAITKIYNTDRQKASRKCRAFAERFSWNNVIDKFMNPFLEECELELYPKITSSGISSWRQELTTI